MTAAELAAQFDRSFALAHPETAPQLDVIAIELAGERYALRITDIASLAVDRAITRVPTTRAGLLGIAGFRGVLVPVFDLAAILGHPPAPAARWLVIAASAPIAFAFERFGGHLRVPRAAAGGDVLEVAGTLYSLVDVANLVAALASGEVR
jgi:purine-binding chemotaxis protein CheW